MLNEILREDLINNGVGYDDACGVAHPPTLVSTSSELAREERGVIYRPTY